MQSWYEARDACAGRGGRLATIHNQQESNTVASFAPVSQGYPRKVYINILYVAQQSKVQCNFSHEFQNLVFNKVN